jgi:hypothetical protein
VIVNNRDGGTLSFTADEWRTFGQPTAGRKTA